jgi:hypothetical protein
MQTLREPRMKQVEEKLAAWKGIYERLSKAQSTLNLIISQPHRHSDLSVLRADIACLKAESDAAMKAVEDEISAMKTSGEQRRSRSDGAASTPAQ